MAGRIRPGKWKTAAQITAIIIILIILVVIGNSALATLADPGAESDHGRGLLRAWLFLMLDRVRVFLVYVLTMCMSPSFPAVSISASTGACCAKSWPCTKRRATASPDDEPLRSLVRACDWQSLRLSQLYPVAALRSGRKTYSTTGAGFIRNVAPDLATLRHGFGLWAVAACADRAVAGRLIRQQSPCPIYAEELPAAGSDDPAHHHRRMGRSIGFPSPFCRAPGDFCSRVSCPVSHLYRCLEAARHSPVVQSLPGGWGVVLDDVGRRRCFRRCMWFFGLWHGLGPFWAAWRISLIPYDR